MFQRSITGAPYCAPSTQGAAVPSSRLPPSTAGRPIQRAPSTPAEVPVRRRARPVRRRGAMRPGAAPGRLGPTPRPRSRHRAPDGSRTTIRARARGSPPWSGPRSRRSPIRRGRARSHRRPGPASRRCAAPAARAAQHLDRAKVAQDPAQRDGLTLAMRCSGRSVRRCAGRSCSTPSRRDGEAKAPRRPAARARRRPAPQRSRPRSSVVLLTPLSWSPRRSCRSRRSGRAAPGPWPGRPRPCRRRRRQPWWPC